MRLVTGVAPVNRISSRVTDSLAAVVKGHERRQINYLSECHGKVTRTLGRFKHGILACKLAVRRKRHSLQSGVTLSPGGQPMGSVSHLSSGFGR